MTSLKKLCTDPSAWDWCATFEHSLCSENKHFSELHNFSAYEISDLLATVNCFFTILTRTNEDFYKSRTNLHYLDDARDSIVVPLDQCSQNLKYRNQQLFPCNDNVIQLCITSKIVSRVSLYLLSLVTSNTL